MTIVVGLAPGERGVAALQLAQLLARTSGEPLAVCSVVPTPWPPHPNKLDAEYLDYLDRAAHQALEQAEQRLDGVPATFDVHTDSTVHAGLIAAAQEHDATMVVLGSSESGALGRVALGGVADRISRDATVPIAVAPRGFNSAPGSSVRRITVGFGRAADHGELLAAVGAVAANLGAPVRVASFAVRPVTAFLGSISGNAEELVVTEWAAATHAALVAAVAELDESTGGTVPLTSVLGYGHSWAEALGDIPWEAGDVLAIGASSSSPIGRFFLGSHASKIVRHSPVPVVLVPRAVPEREPG